MLMLPKPAIDEDELIVIRDARVKGSPEHSWLLNVVLDGLEPLDTPSDLPNVY